jgi:cold shock CspA family protein
MKEKIKATNQTATLTMWDNSRGFGFLKNDAPRTPNTFVHIFQLRKSDVFEPIETGQRYLFDVAECKRRPGLYEAINLRRLAGLAPDDTPAPQRPWWENRVDEDAR